MSSQEEQFIELLIQLKRTTPDQARTILMSTPQVAYALISLMVKMNAVDVQVLQKTVAAFSTSASPQPVAAPSVSPVVPAPAVPQRMMQASYHTPPPQSQTPPVYTAPSTTTYSNSTGHAMQTQGTNAYGTPSQYPGQSTGYGAPSQPATLGNIPEALAAMPDEQKAMIMRIIVMTPEQINQLPAVERDGIIQLRATLGLPS